MTVRIFALISCVIFFLVAAVHLVRVVLQWPVVIGSWSVPMWPSIAVIVVAGLLSFAGFRIYQAQKVSLFR